MTYLYPYVQCRKHYFLCISGDPVKQLSRCFPRVNGFQGGSYSLSEVNSSTNLPLSNRIAHHPRKGAKIGFGLAIRFDFLENVH